MVPMIPRRATLSILVLLFAASAQAESPNWRTTKRIFAVSGCALQAVDLYTTHRALNRPGLIEGNPLLRRSDGGIRWSVALPTKAVACAMPLIFNNPKLDRFWTFYGIGQTGLYSSLSIANARK